MLFPHDLPDADVRHLPAWLSPAEADALQRDLQAGVPWEVHRIRMFGSWVDSPRLSCWIGDPQARYLYSGAEFVPHPWPPSLQGMRERLQDDGFGRFNSVLLNRYRSGGDYMGWHSDDEPELGPAPVIASAAAAPATTSGKNPPSVTGTPRTAGRSASVAPTITPSVPSEPIISATRS